MQIECSICCEMLTDSSTEEVCATFCGHIFHDGCLTDWLSRSPTCPSCRTAMRPIDCVRLFVTNSHQRSAKIAAIELLSPDEKLRLSQLKSTISTAIASLRNLHSKIESISGAKASGVDSLRLCEKIRKKLLQDFGGTNANNDSSQIDLKNTEKKISDALGHIAVFEQKMFLTNRSLITMANELQISSSGDQNRNSSAPVKNFLNVDSAKK